MTALKIVVLIVGVRKQGYRVIAADAPAVWNHLEWVSSFEKFLDALGVHQVWISLADKFRLESYEERSRCLDWL